ncbi:MAG: extracellular solute-binding protein [Candidatus Hydrogenedentes bacterium]|nr:extracellular solute-binding protein [Candidatus Hydrogenedentota bacterium]
MKHIVQTMAILVVLIAVGCGESHAPEVVVYVAHDEMYSRPVLDTFTQKTGIIVRAVYDTEASKTTGLANRLIAEQSRPRADVFWNNEIAQTIVLANKGVFGPYRSPSASAIPDAFKDLTGMWTGFAARARVIIYNTDMLTEPPASIMDFVKPEWRGKLAIARPLFGTTATHAAALFAAWGDERAKIFVSDLVSNDVAILAGNATVRDMVASGEFAAGLTDTDDANGAVIDGKPVKWLFPDQEEGGLGTLVLPNTVALVKDAPNADAGKKLIDYLLGPEVEGSLARARSIQIPLNPSVESPPEVPHMSSIRAMQVDFNDVAAKMDTAMDFSRNTFNQ